MNGLIAEVLYLAHDKWNEQLASEQKIKENRRQYLKEYLEEFVEREPKCMKELEMIVEYGQEDDYIVIMTGVLNILKNSYPETAKSIKIRRLTKELKKYLHE